MSKINPQNMSREELLDYVQFLKNELQQCVSSIEFLHCCLTEPSFTYAYPTMTIDHIKEIEEIIGKRREYCIHSITQEGCQSCTERNEAFKLKNKFKP